MCCLTPLVQEITPEEPGIPLDMFNAQGERPRFDSDVSFETRWKLCLRGAEYVVDKAGPCRRDQQSSASMLTL